MDTTPVRSEQVSALPLSDGQATGARPASRPALQAHLSLWDAVSIIVGIVIGATIYKSPQLIMANVSSPTMGLLAWGLGGVLSLIGALCYAELATTYPRSGGDYVYLSRAFGDWCGFLFGWAQLAVLLTASMAMMAFVFGDYAVRIWPPPDTTVPAELRAEETQLRASLEAQKTKLDESSAWQALQAQIRPYNTRRELWTAGFAALAVVALALTNIVGVVLGKMMQNVLSLVKLIGLGAIVYAGFEYGSQEILQEPSRVPETTSFGTAMIFVLYAYGGWNDAAFVAAEVRNRRNILRSLLLGTALITVIYLAVNVAYLRALGFEKMRDSNTVAAEVGQLALGDRGSLAISVLVMVSVLGAINGLTYTGSRVYSTLGADHSLFAILGRWSPRYGTPVWAFLIQAAVTLAMIVGVGTPYGRSAIDWCVTTAGLAPMPWDRYFGGFDTLLSGTSPVFWGFFLLTGLSLFALRQRDPDLERPFQVALFPLLPLIFCSYCAYMLYSAIDYAKWISLIGVLPLAVGLVLYAISRRSDSEAAMRT
jgi:amino acid transporter